MSEQAVYIRGKGGPEVLEIADYAVRAPGANEVSVRVAAAGVNRADSLQRRGFYPAPPGVIPDVPGLEFAGVVDQIGAEVRGFKSGDRVMGVVPGGAMATRVVIAAAELIPVPARLSLEEAAAIPEVFMTVFDAVFEQAALGRGETLLVHAVGSGIGTAAIQMARVIGAQCIGTSRSAAKLERCKKLGLDHGVLVDDKTFSKKVLEVAPQGVNVVLDTIGAAYLGENVRVLALLGRIVTIGLLGGVQAELPLGLLLQKRASIRGSVLRSRSAVEKAHLVSCFIKEVLPHFESAEYAPVIDEILPMQRVREAHQRLDADETFGKIVLRW